METIEMPLKAEKGKLARKPYRFSRELIEEVDKELKAVTHRLFKGDLLRKITSLRPLRREEKVMDLPSHSRTFCAPQRKLLPRSRNRPKELIEEAD